MTAYDGTLTPDQGFGLPRFGANDAATLRVLLCDGHRMVLEILSDTLSSRAAMEVAKATALTEALALAETTCDLDLIVLDADLPGMRGYEGLVRMVALRKAPVAVLAGTVLPGMADAVKAAGGVGLLSKTQGVFEIVQRMLELGQGGSFFFPVEAESKAPSASRLNEKQMRVMRMIEAGLSNGAIGAAMGIPLSMVKMHVRSIFKRLDARNRTDAVRIWHSGAAARGPDDACIH